MADKDEVEAGPTTLKDKLAKGVDGGAMNLSSRDIAEYSKEEKKAPVAVAGDVETTIPPGAEDDKLLAAGGEDTVSDKVKGEIAEGGLTNMTVPVPDDESVLPQAIVITEQERESFLDSVVSGDRYTQSFSLFNDKVVGTFRSRALKESTAVVAQLQREVRAGDLSTVIAYSTRVRNMLLAAQVQVLSGDEYPVLHGPLMQQVDGEKVVKPAWLKQVGTWEEKHEGLVSALYEQLRIFERKYWTMVINANKQNFWNPEESTSE